jgi:hypothetical protein
MVQTEMIVAVLHTLLAFGALWILIFYCWRSQRLDALRDKLFEVRHELFTMAERKEIAFEHPAYRLLRAQVNRMLARAHKLTGLMLLLRAPERTENPRQRWIESLTTVPEETRQKLQAIEDRMGVAVIRHVIVGSPFTVLILLCGMIGSAMIRRKGGPQAQPHRIIADEVARSIEALDRIPSEDKEALTAVG